MDALARLERSMYIFGALCECVPHLVRLFSWSDQIMALHPKKDVKLYVIFKCTERDAEYLIPDGSQTAYLLCVQSVCSICSARGLNTQTQLICFPFSRAAHASSTDNIHSLHNDIQIYIS